MVRTACLRLLLVAAGCLLSSGSASAQLKVGVINVQEAMLSTAELKKAQADLEAKFKPRQDEVAKIQAELQGLQQQLQTQQDKLTPTALQDLQTRGQRRQRELQRLTEDLQQEVERDRNDVLARTGQRMQEVVRKLAEEKALDMVVDASNTLYFKPALDLSKDAAAAYDRTYPVK